MILGTNICDSKTNGLSTIPHKFILCSFSKEIGNLTGLMGEYWLCKIRQIGIKENRDPIFKVKEIGTLWYLIQANVATIFFWVHGSWQEWTVSHGPWHSISYPKYLRPSLRILNHPVSLLSLLHCKLFRNRVCILISEFLTTFTTFSMMPCQMVSVCRMTDICASMHYKGSWAKCLYHSAYL